MKVFFVIAGVLCASLVAFCVHVKLGNYIGGVVSLRMAGVGIAHPPYDTAITVIAAITSVLPVAGSFIIFLLIYDRMPGRSPLAKGMVFAALRLLSEGELIRMPLMNALVGNPLFVVILQQSEIWLTNILMSLILAYSINSIKQRQQTLSS